MHMLSGVPTEIVFESECSNESASYLFKFGFIFIYTISSLVKTEEVESMMYGCFDSV